MKRQKLVLIGGGGHCKSCIDVINQTNKYQILGILDPKLEFGSTILGHEIIGDDSRIQSLVSSEVEFLITIGQIKTSKIRASVFNELMRCEAKMATVISPRAYVAEGANIGIGSIIMHNVTINTNVSIGINAILNTACNIEHDNIIGDNCHISTGAMLNGNCIIGNGVFIGSNATISNNIKISDDVIVGLGAIVFRDIEQSGVYKIKL